MAGGTEVTLLGNGFFQGLEVMFGDTEATTTTFWGEKCLNCIAPPALQPGTVAVVFKHEHHQYTSTHTQTQSRHPVFTYTDDREHELFKLALQTLSKQIPHLSSLLCNTIDEVIDGSEVIVVGHQSPEFANALTKTRADQIVIDLVRVPIYGSLLQADYRGICW